MHMQMFSKMSVYAFIQILYQYMHFKARVLCHFHSGIAEQGGGGRGGGLGGGTCHHIFLKFEEVSKKKRFVLPPPQY